MPKVLLEEKDITAVQQEACGIGMAQEMRVETPNAGLLR